MLAVPERFRKVPAWSLFLVGGLFAAVFLALALGPIALHFLQAASRERGFELSAESCRLGPGKLVLRKVHLISNGGPRLDARFETLSLGVGWGVELKSVAATQGRIELTGSLDAFRRWTGSSGGNEAGKGGDGKKRRLSLDNVTLVWQLQEGTTLEIRNLVLGESKPGLLTMAAPSAFFEQPKRKLSLEGIAAELDASQRLLTELRIESGHLEWKPETEGLSPSRAAAVPALAKGPNGTEPETQPTAGIAAPVHTVADKAEGSPLITWRRALDAVAAQARKHLAPRAALELASLNLRLGDGPKALGIGPERVLAYREGESLVVKLEPAEKLGSQSKPLLIEGTLPLEPEQPVSVHVQGGPVSLAELGVSNGDLGLVDTQTATVRASGKLVLTAGGQNLTVLGDGRLSQLSIDDPHLSTNRVESLDVGLLADGEVDVGAHTLKLAQGVFQLGELSLTVKGSVEKNPDHFAIDVEFQVPLTLCQSVATSLPVGLFPQGPEVTMSGTLALTGRLKADTRELSKLEASWKLDNQCRISSIGSELDPKRFRGPFIHQVLGSNGDPLFLETGPGSRAFTMFQDLPRAMIAAVLVSEDGNFFRHHGFDHTALQRSLQDNLKAGRFVRGGSTVSMQLAKNLYLKREKTLSRKLQEAFFTHLLEQELTKEEILELYLSVIEFGPDVYGIRQAADYYFGLEPSQLSVAQCFFLGSILPNPKQDRFTPEGVLKPRWASYLKTLMNIAKKRGHLSDSELSQGLNEEVRRQSPGEPKSDLLGDAADHSEDWLLVPSPRFE